MLFKLRLPLIFSLITIFSLIIMGRQIYSHTSEMLLENKKGEMALIAEEGSIAFESFFESRLLEVSYLTQHGMVQTSLLGASVSSNQHHYPEMNEYFTNLAAAREDIRDAFLMLPNGRVIASSAPLSIGLDLSDRGYFQDALQGKSTVSNLLVDRVEQDSVLFVAAPVYSYSSETVIGVIGNIIDRTNTSRHLQNLVSEDVGTAYLVDAEGVIIFHENGVLVGGQYRSDLLSESIRNDIPEQSFEFQDKDGNHFAVYRPIAGTSWYLLIEQNVDYLHLQASDTLDYIVLVGIFAVVMAVLASISLGQVIIRPIDVMTHMMVKIAEGDHTLRSTYANQDEVGKMSRQMNSMLDTLTEQIRTLEEEKSLLQASEESLDLKYRELRKSNDALRAQNIDLRKHVVYNSKID